jgi:hypothetical protein
MWQIVVQKTISNGKIERDFANHSTVKVPIAVERVAKAALNSFW